MIRILNLCLLLALSACSEPSSPISEDGHEYRDGAYLWRPVRITMALHDGDHFGTKGKYIRLDQELEQNETGWSMSILDLPDTWDIDSLRFDGLYISFQNQHGEHFKVMPPDLNDLDFAILNGGDKTDKELESLWRKYALQK